MDMAVPGPSPVKLADRIEMLDVLRGIAICGILLMNIPVMGMIGELDMPALPAAWNADWIAWGVQNTLFEGTMRGLFTMLFGAGMLLMLRKAEVSPPEVAPFDVWARRCLALILLGGIQFVLFLWPGEILVNYGITGLFLLAMRSARPRTLIVGAAVVLLMVSAFYAEKRVDQASIVQASIAADAAKAAGRELTDAQAASIEARDGVIAMFHPNPDQVAQEVRQRTHFPSVLRWSISQWTDWNMGGSEWYLQICESLGFMMIGMALFRIGILTGRAKTTTYLAMMLFGYGIGFAIRLCLLYRFSLTGFDFDVQKLSLGATALRNFAYEPARLAITIGHVGLIVLLFRSGALGRATPLRALGRMALTVYSLQSILTSILFYGMGWVGSFGFAQLMGISAVIWLLTCLFAMGWLSRHDMGPAERFLRGMAYGRDRLDTVKAR